MHTAESTTDSLRSGRIGVSLRGGRLLHLPTWILQDASGRHCMRLRSGPAFLCICINHHKVCKTFASAILAIHYDGLNQCRHCPYLRRLAIYANGCKWWGSRLWHRPSHPFHPILSSSVIQEMITRPHGRRLHCSRTCMDPNRISAGIFHLGGKVGRKSVQVF